MHITIALVLLILALPCFLASAAGVPSRIGITPLGLAFLTASLLAGAVV